MRALIHFMENRWVNSGRLYFGVYKITPDGDCSHEIKKRSLLGIKVMTNLDSISITSDMQMIPPLWQKVKRN